MTILVRYFQFEKVKNTFEMHYLLNLIIIAIHYYYFYYLITKNIFEILIKLIKI